MSQVSEALAAALTHHRARRLQDAERLYRQALEIDPHQPDALHLLGVLAHQAGRPDAAVELIRRAIGWEPRQPVFHGNLGKVLKSQGRLDEAATCYRRALELDPRSLEACLGLAALLDDWNRFDEAAALYRRALEIKPDDPQVMDCLFEALKNEGRPEEAADQMRRALDIEPSDKRRFALATVLPVIPRSTDEITRYRRRLTDRLSTLIADGARFDAARDVLPSLFSLAYQGMNDRPVQELVSRLYTDRQSADAPLRRSRPRAGEKIRVGFLSRHLQNRHSVGKLTRGFIERLSRGSFHVVVLALGEHGDPSAGQIRDEADQYVLLPPTVELARRTIVDAALDVLIYPDIGMNPVASALARARLAPVQCVTWGHPVTTGIPQIDYFLSSELIEPEDADEHYTERLVRFKSLPAFYRRPELPASHKSRADFGLAEGRHVYLCPQNLFKLHPDFDRPLAEILRRDPAGEVVLIEGKAPRWRELLMERFGAAFPDAIDRVRFLPRQDYQDFLHLLAVADVVLDPFHFGGGNTTYQALALGTPIVTWPSAFMRGRAAYGCYRKMGLADCVAIDMDDYAGIAVRLGTDPAYRRQIRDKILAQAHTLFDDHQAVRELEQFLLRVVEGETIDPKPPQTEPLHPVDRPPSPAEEPVTLLIHQALNDAIQHHQGGRPQEAEAIYRQVLEHDPQQPDALHLLGLLAYQSGRHRQAVDYIRGAIRVRPLEAAFHCDLGIVHRALGELDQAVSAYGRALELKPDFANAHYNLGNVRRQQGQLEAAKTAFRRALSANPAHSQAANNLGKLLHEEGEIEEATELFRQAVQAAPNSAEAHYNLGRMLSAQGKTDETVAALRRSVAANANYFEVQLDLARALYRKKELTPAAEALRQAVRLAPDSAEAHYGLGSVFFEFGDVEKSISYYQQALERKPDYAEAHNGLGIALRSCGKLPEAAEHFRRAVQAKPRMGAYNNLGLTYHEMGKLEEAIAVFRQGEKMGPTDADLENNYGNTLFALERITEAVVHYRKALQVKPDNVAALNNLGNALKRQGQVDEAIASLGRALEIEPGHAQALNNLGSAYQTRQQYGKAAACYRQALQSNPRLVEACNNLGTIHYQRKNVAEAFACYRRALEIKPDHPDTLNNLAEALKDGGQTEEAVAMIQKAQELKPSTKRRFALATVLPAIGRSVEELARWRGRTVDQLSAMIEEGVQLDPARDVVPALFYLAYQGMNDRPIQEMVTRLYAQETELLKPRSPGDRDPSDKIRVGFISKYFRNHTIGKLSQGLIAQLSRRTFDVTVFSLEAHDDANARHIQRHADRYLVVPDDVGKARQIVADARLDVLLYTDVGMDPMTSALARARLAPVQCVTWGHPVTTGIPQIDYFLSSNLLEPPGAEEHYTERLVRLDTLPVYFHRPVLSSPPRARADFGLSDSSHVYLCPQSLFKFHPDFDGPMAQILRRDSRGEVVLIEGAFPHWKELLMDRFRAAIPDVADRIRFVPHQKLDDFLHLVALADVVLDPFHFGGGSSTYETFALGTPIVTWPSEFMRGRAAYACYRKMGLPDCVASDADDYVDRAVRLGTDRAYRDRIRAKILAAAAVLFEDQEAVRQIERFFLQAVQDLRDAGRPLHDEHGPHPHWPQRRPGVSLPSDRWECP